MIFDTHAHYDDEQFDADREALLSQMKENGIERIADIGASMASSKEALLLSEKYDFIYAVVGVHPSEVEELNDDKLEELRIMSRKPKCVAIGEIGLDYHWPEPSRELQQHWFSRQLSLAREEHKPVVIHSREAAEDTLRIMKEQKAEEIGGVVHCFSYSKEIARICADMGFYIGVGGVITFKNGKKLKETVADLPLDKILLETDCPYLAPEPYRGKRNSSLFLPYVVEAIADIKGISKEEVMDVTYNNALRFYGL
ncbi:TatD family hydrolase [Butyrivibrio proteoclasticus]|uniref:TatD family hydrolase n=1 Tax=Butyrivibrio proteoclasticus TaxID=43305 RepID=UPI00047EA311|nr:TatD family hydrolase [Butyrivibrio proteoclasticus]